MVGFTRAPRDEANRLLDFSKPEDPVPAGRAHVDQDEVQARTFMKEFGIPYALEEGNRAMIINLWRPLKVSSTAEVCMSMLK